MIAANEVGCQFVFGCIGAHFPAMAFGYELLSRAVGLGKAICFGGFRRSGEAVCCGISGYVWDAIHCPVSSHDEQGEARGRAISVVLGAVQASKARQAVRTRLLC